MTVVVSYDVSTLKAEGRRRLRRIAQCCKDYGQRVQFSVFECRVGETQWVLLRQRLLAEFAEKEDSLRFYFLGDEAQRRTEHHGIKGTTDFEGPLVV